MTLYIKTGTYNDKGEKWCNNCRKYQPLSEFGKNRVAKDKLNWSCFVSIKEAAAKLRTNKPKTLPMQQEKLDNIGDATDMAIKQLKVSYPELKLANPYAYQRPDAWDNYINNINSKSI